MLKTKTIRISNYPGTIVTDFPKGKEVPRMIELLGGQPIANYTDEAWGKRIVECVNQCVKDGI